MGSQSDKDDMPNPLMPPELDKLPIAFTAPTDGAAGFNFIKIGG